MEDFPFFKGTAVLELYTDSVFRYEPFGIFLVFSYRIPKGNLVGKFGIIKLAGALYSHIMVTSDHNIRRDSSIEVKNEVILWEGYLLKPGTLYFNLCPSDMLIPTYGPVRPSVLALSFSLSALACVPREHDREKESGDA